MNYKYIPTVCIARVMATVHPCYKRKERGANSDTLVSYLGLCTTFLAAPGQNPLPLFISRAVKCLQSFSTLSGARCHYTLNHNHHHCVSLQCTTEESFLHVFLVGNGFSTQVAQLWSGISGATGKRTVSGHLDFFLVDPELAWCGTKIESTGKGKLLYLCIRQQLTPFSHMPGLQRRVSQAELAHGLLPGRSRCLAACDRGQLLPVKGREGIKAPLILLVLSLITQHAALKGGRRSTHHRNWLVFAAPWSHMTHFCFTFFFFSFGRACRASLSDLLSSLCS
ncbi:uncharacterized protein J3D65DRAFT_388400 [Phyllosticta citribraziliensis]|uniref:Uncharacterized protein n=1 Tax=Phyllosticta citribraziliensis TaxID=989973 RepID=A0ABR1LKM5_9PEZI